MINNVDTSKIHCFLGVMFNKTRNQLGIFRVNLNHKDVDQEVWSSLAERGGKSLCKWAGRGAWTDQEP